MPSRGRPTAQPDTERRWTSERDRVRDEEAVGSNPATPTRKTAVQGRLSAIRRPALTPFRSGDGGLGTVAKAQCPGAPARCWPGRRSGGCAADPDTHRHQDSPLEREATNHLSDLPDVRVPLNSTRTLPSPLYHRSSSASRSKVPAVSMENACILLQGSEVKPRFFPVSPWTLTAMCRLFVKTQSHALPRSTTTLLPLRSGWG